MSEESGIKTPEPSMSKSIEKLAAALAKAQGELESVGRNSTNPFFKKDYAGLDAVWNEIRKPFSENGIAIIQQSDPWDGGVLLTTRLIHTSGQWIKGKLFMKPEGTGPQKMGSAMTYARRYGLMAMTGAVQAGEDDDGNGAQNGDSKPPPPKPDYNRKPKSLAHKMGFHSDFVKLCDWSMEDAQAFMVKFTGKDSTEKLTEEELKTIMKQMQDTSFKDALLICDGD